MISLSSLLLAAVTYCSPVHIEVSLAGNFGEPRPNHFHGGLDIKTQQEEGKAIYTIGDGYVSRVSVNLGGMGNAIYVRHPDGYTSVYGHLQRFAPGIEALVRKYQYQHQCTDVDIEFDARDYPVTKGQIIALSGDTGASMGPHLHLEIRDNATGNLMDPLEFIPELLTDTVSPKAHALMAYPMEGEGWFCGKTEQQRFDFFDHDLRQEFTAWGKVGFGLYADDYMQGSANPCGIRYTTLLVDGKEVFSSNVHNIPMNDNPQVNIWGDYDYYMDNQQWFMRSFILPGNTLSILKTDATKGIIDFNEEREYQIRYILSDFFGNKTEYPFVVRGVRDSLLLVSDSLNTEGMVRLADKRKSLTVEKEQGPDDMPPEVLPINERRWKEEPVLIFDLRDRQSGIRDYKAYIDDQFVVFEHVKKSSRIICDLRHTPITPNGQERQLRILATDSTGNTATYNTVVVY